MISLTHGSRSGMMVHVRSASLFLASTVLAVVGAVSLLYLHKVQRDFSAPTAMTMGAARAKGALFGKRASSGQSFCWVSYEFTPPDEPQPPPPPSPEDLELEREMEYFVEPEEAFTRDEIE